MNTTQDMVTTAQALLDANSDQTNTLEGKLQDLRSDLSNLQTQVEARSQASSSYEEMLQAALEDQQRAEGYAALSKDTPREQSAIKAASAQRKTFQAIQQDYDQKKSEKDQLDRADQKRELELSAQIQATQKELDGVRAARSKISLGHQQAHSELGAAKFQAHMNAYHAKQQEVEAIKSQLVTAQMDLHDVYTAALDDMEAWPEYRREIATLEDVDDSTMQLLKIAHLYMDTILTDHEQVDGTVNLPALHGSWGHQSIWNTIIVNEGALHLVLGRSTGKDKGLQDRCDLLQRVIEEYRNYVRND